MLSIYKKVLTCPTFRHLIPQAHLSLGGKLAFVEKDEVPSKVVKPPARKSIKISLVDGTKTVAYSTLEEATRLSERRGLKLIKVSDYDKKRGCPLYTMKSLDELRKELQSVSNSSGHQAKSSKLVMLSHKLADNDLRIKINHMMKWVAKNHEVRVSISGSDEVPSAAESVYKKIESELLSSARILQKRQSGKDIKFHVVPLKKSTTPPSTETNRLDDKEINY